MLGAVFQKLRDRTSIRQQTALMAGLLCVLTVTAVAGAGAVLARRQAVADTDAALVTLARTMTERLDARMFERYREIRNVASFAPLSPVWTGDSAGIRSVLAQLQTTLPEYAWIGFATPDGTVRAATKGMLEGVSVAQRPWFTNGLKGPTVEDVHDAKLLDGLLRTSPDQAPFRFVDVAVPVKDDAGRVVGVLGAHMSWGWADEVRANVLANDRSVLDAELWVLSRDGEVLIGPANARSFAGQLLVRAGSADGVALIDDTGSTPTLTAVVATKGQGDYPGLGWLVVARSPVATALAPANRLFATIIAVGAFVALCGAFLALLLAGHTMRPLERLSRNVDLIGRDSGATMVGWQHGSQDVLVMSASIRSLLRRLGSVIESEREAREAAATLESRAAEQMALAEERTLRLGKDLHELQQLAVTDPLTGLLNRRGFGPFGADAMGYFRRKGTAAAVVMLDIDHFKKINDTHGHGAGDAVLRSLGTILARLVRETDKVSRFGGEEFVVLLRETGEAQALILAERIRETVAATSIMHDGRELNITVSAGIAAIIDGDRDIEDVVERADRALYSAKTSGRNRVALASDLASAQVA
ncbi:sensor domain-containing diguanylate cyclase [Ancylobacter sp. A5.8]|uniref:sensor domain-containing diguanylate cyclase n=1 Tax=Ancylobacter gelatini TaxID=2919920 RepID=UPI001F4D95AD|nr:sensor domain-containing diguanylate cyclase [Ancylobacter gelatini]MCJ8143968.1 sensor domain-containing diguanylate cyclase [Ancylobacter gelatini]